jgi:predicted DNA-binding transcriptional regulator AlpA
MQSGFEDPSQLVDGRDKEAVMEPIQNQETGRSLVPTKSDIAAGGRGAFPSLLSRGLSIRQIAADLGVSTSTAYKWSSRGRPWFPRSIRLRNGDIRVRRDWYEEWLAELED